mgnify:FL=1
MVELNEDDATILLQAAVENLITINVEIKKMEASRDFDRPEIGHFQAKIRRLERVIVELEKKLFLP